MRLTIRVLLSIMNALECSLDEICNKYRGNGAYYEKFVAVRKSQKLTNQAMHRILDDMIDSGEGE